MQKKYTDTIAFNYYRMGKKENAKLHETNMSQKKERKRGKENIKWQKPNTAIIRIKVKEDNPSTIRLD